MNGPASAVVVGARGGVGAAFVEQLTRSGVFERVFATSTDPAWCEAPAADPRVQRVHADILNDDALGRARAAIDDEGAPLRVVINCAGLLHEAGLRPERTWRELDLEVMRRVFDVNTFGVGLLVKHLVPAIPRRGRALFASLSARVGSIEDNRRGGWYSYRAAKAAQNQLIRTASIEAKRMYPELVLTTLHPGTVRTALSEPFTKRLPKDYVVFSPEESCAHLTQVLGDLRPADSGGLFAWDGEPVPW